MNTVLKIFLSMSVSGSLLILLLLLGKRFLQNKISRQWQYYIWLIVVLRLLLPFGPETSLMGKAYQAVDLAIRQTVSLPQQQPIQNKPVQGSSGGNLAPAVEAELDSERLSGPTDDLTAARPLQDIWALFIDHIWLVWLVVALGLLIRKITIYQGFIRYIGAGLAPVSNTEMLNRLSIIAEQSGVKRPIELCVNPLVSSPLLIGFFHPCIVLPSENIPEKDFQYIILHELIHYKRRDMFYKWLVQVTVCLHWFNPLAHLMSREMTKACEFSCDEAVLAKMGCDSAQDYGKTLLDAMAAVGKYKESLGAVTLSENKRLLKERLEAIMRFKGRSKTARLLAVVLALCVVLGAAFIGVYPVLATSDQATGKPVTTENENSTQAGTNTRIGDYAAQAERYYKADSLPLFQIAFSRLDESAQKTWLEKFYADGDFAFFSVAVRSLNADNPLLADYAEKAYTDGETAFFSTLTDCMNEGELELWLDRALKDDKWAFQSILFDKLHMDDEKDAQEKVWAEQQMEAYQAVGVTIDGKNYYYKGQLVNIFLDVRANKSFCTLDMNPSGTVNIKIIRDVNDRITGVAYMTEAEVTELLGDMGDPDNTANAEDHPG